MAALCGGGCSVRRMAINQVASALAGSSGGSAFSTDNDPELIREAVPFGLKTMETLLGETPNNGGLLLALASGFTQYSYAFVAEDADAIESQDFAKAVTMRARARKLYLRGRDYGLRALELRHAGFAKHVRENPTAAVKAATRDDVPLLYWTGAAWAAAITLDKSDAKMMAELPVAAAMMQRALDLDEAWNAGAIHGFFIAYDGGRSAAMGGSVERARKHFERAVKLSGGMQAAPYVSFAETVSVAQQKKDEFNQLLDKALAIDPDKKPEWRLVNTITQERARRLKANEEDLFP
jgi:predicted anti-sigma-YlaC factor YlaD